MKKDKDVRAFTKFIVFFIMIGLAVLLSESLSAQPTAQSGWQKIQEVEIPDGLEIQSGIDSEGIPKYWFQFGEVKVFMDARTHNDYKEGTVVLILVEWKVLKTGRYRYTIKRKSSNDNNVRINFDELFYENKVCTC